MEPNIPKIKSTENYLQEQIISTYKLLHRIPEIGLHEYFTTNFIKQFIQKIEGVTIIKPIKDITGLICQITPLNSNFASEKYLFRCDIDALQFQEKSNLDYASINGLHHACGHDGHTCMMLYAIRQISKNRQKLKRSIIFCFQPGEEGHGGAKKVFEAYPDIIEGVKHCFALHVGNHRPKGILSIPQKYVTCNSNKFQIQIVGKAAHIMLDHLAVDANLIGSKIMTHIYELRQRYRDKHNVRLAVTKCSGGNVINAISDKMQIIGPIRSEVLKIHYEVQQQLEKFVTQLCQKQKAQFKIRFTNLDYRAVENNEDVNKIVAQIGQGIFENIEYVGSSMAGEDFCQFSERRPSSYCILGVGLPDSFDKSSGQSIFPIHSNKFKLDETALQLGIKFWIKLAFSQK